MIREYFHCYAGTFELLCLILQQNTYCKELPVEHSRRENHIPEGISEIRRIPLCGRD